MQATFPSVEFSDPEVTVKELTLLVTEFGEQLKAPELLSPSHKVTATGRKAATPKGHPCHHLNPKSQHIPAQGPARNAEHSQDIQWY